ncbi:MAG: C-type lectin domain-containing protein [Desulfovibrionaceae bacterium]|nr:C-type lectin domain-containing protein [Desulfovibrionaceae bacterium]
MSIYRFYGLLCIVFLGLIVGDAVINAEKHGQPLPQGVIALSESKMTWAEGKAFCRQQGGRLPRINNLEAWDGANPPRDTIPIEGFGAYGAPWPSGLPNYAYFVTETAHPAIPGYSWLIYNNGGNVGVLAYQRRTYRFICVP